MESIAASSQFCIPALLSTRESSQSQHYGLQHLNPFHHLDHGPCCTKQHMVQTKSSSQKSSQLSWLSLAADIMRSVWERALKPNWELELQSTTMPSGKASPSRPAGKLVWTQGMLSISRNLLS